MFVSRKLPVSPDQCSLRWSAMIGRVLLVPKRKHPSVTEPRAYDATAHVLSAHSVRSSACSRR